MRAWALQLQLPAASLEVVTRAQGHPGPTASSSAPRAALPSIPEPQAAEVSHSYLGGKPVFWLLLLKPTHAPSSHPVHFLKT